MAKRSTKTTKKKKKTAAGRGSTRKKTAARRPASKKKKKTKTKASTRKKTTRKKAAGKKTTKKKAAGKKKVAKKRVTKKKPTSAKRTSTKKKVARSSASKKKTTKKKTTKKKAASGKKKTTKKKAASGQKKTTAKKAPTSKSKSKSKTASRSSSRRGAGRSVAEVASAATADAQGYVFINGRRVRMISTRGHVATKKPRSSRAAAAATEAPAKAARPVKTKLSRKELNHYRNVLILKRAEIVGDLSAMEAEALRSGGDNLSHMPIHMADIGTDTFDQDFMLGLAENERQRLREIDDALLRIKNGTYGVCMMTGKQIPKARLEAKPWAKYTIEAARQLEGGWTS